MKDFKRVKILCISGVLLLSVFTFSGCAVLFPKIFGENQNRGFQDCSKVDSIWCDTWCNGIDEWVSCSECYDYHCDDDDC